MSKNVKEMDLDEMVLERDFLQTQIEEMQARFVEIGKELESRRAVWDLEERISFLQSELDIARGPKKTFLQRIFRW